METNRQQCAFRVNNEVIKRIMEKYNIDSREVNDGRSGFLDQIEHKKNSGFNRDIVEDVKIGENNIIVETKEHINNDNQLNKKISEMITSFVLNELGLHAKPESTFTVGDF